jgi:hypothetical protein
MKGENEILAYMSTYGNKKMLILTFIHMKTSFSNHMYVYIYTYIYIYIYIVIISYTMKHFSFCLLVTLFFRESVGCLLENLFIITYFMLVLRISGFFHEYTL